MDGAFLGRECRKMDRSYSSHLHENSGFGWAGGEREPSKDREKGLGRNLPLRGVRPIHYFTITWILETKTASGYRAREDGKNRAVGRAMCNEDGNFYSIRTTLGGKKKVATWPASLVGGRQAALKLQEQWRRILGVSRWS